MLAIFFQMCIIIRVVWNTTIEYAVMAELADAHGSGPCVGDNMQVQVLFPAPLNKRWNRLFQRLFLLYANYKAAVPRTASRHSLCMFGEWSTVMLENPASVRKSISCSLLYIRSPSIVRSHLASRGFVPSASFTIKKPPPGFKIRYTSRKLSTGPGQKYTVSNAVARSNCASPKGSRETSPWTTQQRPFWIACWLIRFVFFTAICE